MGALLKGLKGGLKQRMETGKKIMDLYEYDEEEREVIDKQKQIDLKKFMDEGDEKDKNTVYIDLKLKIRKSLAELNEQDKVLEVIKEKLADSLGAEGFFLK